MLSGQKIIESRIAHRMSHTQYANTMGITLEQLSHYERNELPIPPHVEERWGNKFGKHAPLTQEEAEQRPVNSMRHPDFPHLDLHPEIVARLNSITQGRTSVHWSHETYPMPGHLNHNDMGKFSKLLRCCARLSQADLAKFCGCSDRRIAHMENSNVMICDTTRRCHAVASHYIRTNELPTLAPRIRQPNSSRPPMVVLEKEEAGGNTLGATHHPDFDHLQLHPEVVARLNSIGYTRSNAWTSLRYQITGQKFKLSEMSKYTRLLRCSAAISQRDLAGLCCCSGRAIGDIEQLPYNAASSIPARVHLVLTWYRDTGELLQLTPDHNVMAISGRLGGRFADAREEQQQADIAVNQEHQDDVVPPVNVVEAAPVPLTIDEILTAIEQKWSAHDEEEHLVSTKGSWIPRQFRCRREALPVPFWSNDKTQAVAFGLLAAVALACARQLGAF